MAIVNVTRVAQALNLTERRVQQLVHEGLPREAGGGYDVVKCLLFYIRYLQRVLERKDEPTPEGPDNHGEREARVRLLSADADLREMELAKQRSQFITTEDADKCIAELVSVTTGRIMAIAPRVAPELVGETSRVMIQAKLEKACRQELRFLANSHRTTPRTGEQPGLAPDTPESR
jgi:phage terminase Nu1 subunit (DNA packaging protein)